MVRSLREWSVALVLFAVACGNSETPPAPGRRDVFSADAERQIRALIAEKEGRTPAQQKIESRLIHAMKTFLGEPMAAGVGQFESNVKLDEGYVRVDIRTRGTEAVVRAVEANGGTVIERFEQFHSVTARVPIANVEHIAEEGSVLFIAELLDPELSQELPFKKRVEVEPPPATTDVLHVSQGVVTHGADAARATFGARGQGVKVGVLSDSIDNLATMQANGDLGPVTVLPGQAGSGTGEGTAMLEIVHDMAPDAELFFATAFGGTATFANNIIGLRNAGCDIIVDDVMYFNESPFQDALVAQAVNTVVASGAIYVSSAGNSGSLAKGTAGVYQGNFVDSGTTLTGFPGAVNLFDNGVTSANNDLVSLASSSTTAPTTLSWSDPLAGSNNDYDLFVLNNALSGLVGFSTTTQNGSQDPYEQIVGPQTTNTRVVVLRKTGAQSRFLHVNTNRGRLGIATNGQTRGHSAAVGALSVAATPAAAAFGPGSPTGPFPGVFTTANQLELFSSDGARKMFYNANGSLANSGNPSLLSDGGITRQKPDITGADGVTTSFNPFYGTSAAAPHIAGIAAILKSAVPSATATQIRTAITSSALDIESPGVDVNAGAGIAMAMPALAALGAVPSPSLSVASRTVTPIGGNGNAAWEPGENANLSITLANAGVVAAQSVNATLTTSAPNLTITQPTSAYPNIAVGGSQANSTAFGLRLSNVAACAPVPVHLAVTYTGGSAGFDLTLAVGSAGSPVIVPYAGPVVPIPDGTPGAAVAVPLSVSGLSGAISDLNFRIDGTSCTPAAGATTVGIDHTWVGDLVLTLTSPT
ncbi:MAG TPA: S8 family serine peptidase, partial [Polyangiaceae bacterium]